MNGPRRCSKCGEWMNFMIEYNCSTPYTYWQCPNGCVQDNIHYKFSDSSDMYLDPTKTNYRLTSKYCSQKQCMCENANDRGYCEFTACIYEDALNRGKNEKQIISIPKITIS